MGDLIICAPAPSPWAKSGSSRSLRFHCPEDMRDDSREVLGGSYDIPGLEFERPPRVLDIGANVGAFAVWAMERWPGASVTCFEPNPKAREYLMRNVHDIDAIRPVAVRDSLIASLGTAKLRLGKNNLGEASFHDIGEQSEETIDVQVMSVDDLPACAVLKVDTEGCELEIIRGYLLREKKPTAVVFEFHRVEDRVALDCRLSAEGYVLSRGRVVVPERGTLCYRRAGAA